MDEKKRKEKIRCVDKKKDITRLEE